MEELTKCPICGSENRSLFISCADHSISKETFQLEKCKDCEFVFTNPRPSAQNIGPYYDSGAYISHHAQSSGIIPTIYRAIRNRQFVYKEKILRSFLPKAESILDIGCGTGDFLSYMKQRGAEVQGVEPDADARNLANSKGINVIEPGQLASLNKKFRIITMWHVLEHVHLLKERMEQFETLLEEGGIIIIAVPNLKSFDAAYYGPYWAAYDVPRHLYHFSHKNMNQLFSNYGFKEVGCFPMYYDAYYVSMKSEEYKNSKLSSFIKGPLIGLVSNLSARKTHEYSSQIYVFTK